MISDKHVENRTAGLLKRKILPFTNSGMAEADTGWDLPAKAIVLDVIIDLTTEVAGSSMSVGILSTEGGGDAVGFLDAEITTAAGLVQHTFVDATAGNITLGAFLYETQVTTAAPLVHVWNTFYPTDTNAGKSISYTTSDHAIVGNINVFYIDMA